MLNIHTPNIWAPKYTKQILRDIEREIDRNITIGGDITFHLQSMDRSSIQEIYRKPRDLKWHFRPDGLNRYL